MNVYAIREDGELRFYIAPNMAAAIDAAEASYRYTEFEQRGLEYGAEERRDWLEGILEECTLVGELGSDDGHPVPTTQAAIDVLLERRRQVEVEGFTPDYDDIHADGELALAAACYAAKSTEFRGYGENPAPPLAWPWVPGAWKPKTPRRDLVRACALLLAEIERLDRAAEGKGQ